MRLYVALTDRRWYHYLLEHPELDEVNFWRPQAKSGVPLEPGEPLLFKLHYPERAICGLGFFEGFTKLPVFLAWRSFEAANGAPSYEAFRAQIRALRHGAALSELEELGCVMLRSPVMFRPQDWINEPSDWAPNIVQGKGYDAESGAGRELWDAVLQRLPAAALSGAEYHEGAPVQFEEVTARRRKGQGAFQALVLNAYGRRCAFSQERVWPTLEACHIRPAARGGTHEVSNGLLLRADIHELFDAGYLGIEPKSLEIQASPHLYANFENGAEYRALAGRKPQLPTRPVDWPSATQLEWHMDTIFLR